MSFLFVPFKTHLIYIEYSSKIKIDDNIELHIRSLFVQGSYDIFLYLITLLLNYFFT